MDQIPSYEDAIATTTQQPSTPPAVAPPPSYEEAIATGAQGDGEVPPTYEEAKKSVKYNTPGQKIGSFLEGAAQGILSAPIATGLELGIADKLREVGIDATTKEDIAARQQEHEVLHGAGVGVGMGASMLGGWGEGAALASIGSKIAGGVGLAGELGTAGKIGSLAIQGLTETMGHQIGDSINKQMLGIGDPNAPVASAIAEIGMSGLMGAATGGVLGGIGVGGARGLKWLANSRMGRNAGQFLEDLGSTFKNYTNIDRPAAVHQELQGLFNGNSDVLDGLYGARGIKEEAIQKLAPKMNDAISNQRIEISDLLNKHLEDMNKNPLDYSRKLTKELEGFVRGWEAVETNPESTSAEIFKARDALKGQIQRKSKYGYMTDPDSVAATSRDAFKDIAGELRLHLEDSGVWGDLGNLQSGVNKLVSEFIPTQEKFLPKFTSEAVKGEPFINPDKTLSYMRNVGKKVPVLDAEGNPSQLNPKILKNYVDKSEAMHSGLNDIYAKYGLDGPTQPTPLAAIKGTYDETPDGARFAHFLLGQGTTNLASHVGGAFAGRALGVMSGIPGGAEVGAVVGNSFANKISSMLEPIIGRGNRKAVPAALWALSKFKPTALAETMEHATNVSRGNSAIENGIASLFLGSKIAGQQYVNDNPDVIKKIKEFIAGGGVNQQIQNTLHEQNREKKASPIQGFAEGGEVKAPEPVESAIGSKSINKLSEVYPEHTMLMEAAKGRVYNYLNSLRPLENQPRLAFDDDHVSDHQKRDYEAALKIANKPLSILPELQKGTLTADHVRHLTQMWPEVHTELSKEITKKIMEAKMSGEKPPSHIRQGLSLLMGAPLDSTMNPTNIQAAQAVFASRKMAAQSQAQAQGKTRKGTTGLSDAHKQYETAGQAAESRQQTARR